MKRIPGHLPGKRIMAAVLLTAMILSLTACGAKIPGLEDIVKKYSGQITEEQMKEAGIYGKRKIDLQRAWGEEYSSLDGERSCVTWKSGGKWVAIEFEGDKAVSGALSCTMSATVTEIDGDLAYICPDEGSWERSSGDKIFFSMSWFSDEQAAQVKVGTELKIEYDGILMESYPLQIHEPYFVEIVDWHEAAAPAEEPEPASSAPGEPEPAEEPIPAESSKEESSQAQEPATAPGGEAYIVEIKNDRASYVLPATEIILKEGIYEYYFPSICMDDLDVVLSTGETIPFKDAVDRGFDVITQLTKQGLDYGIGVSREDEEKRESDPVDSRLTEAILSCNGTEDPDVIRLEVHQPLARIRQDDGSTDWYLTYLYREYELKDDGRPRLHYENRSAMTVKLTDDASGSGQKVLGIVNDLTGADFEQKVREIFPKAVSDMTNERFFGDIEPSNYYLLEQKLEKLTGQTPVQAVMDEEFAGIRREFALKLFQEMVKEKPKENVLVAPLSVQWALAMAANGAKGETLREMEEVLCAGSSIYELDPWFRINKNSIDRDAYQQLKMANSLWLRQDRAQGIKEDFRHRIAGNFGADMNTVPFDDEAVKKVNDWVSKSTDGMIPQIIDSFSGDEVLLLINALTFDAKWQEPFFEEHEVPEGFTSLGGEKQDAVILSGRESDSYLQGDGYEGFLKEYEGWQYGFAVFLPEEGTDLQDFIASLTPDGLEWMLHPHIGEMSVSMPKFTSESSLDLVETLEIMGMPRAFKDADFSGIMDDPALAIDEVKHKTFIEVTREGTRAAAVTEVAMDECLPSVEVHVDRPFVYMIVDTTWNVPVFMGVLTSLE